MTRLVLAAAAVATACALMCGCSSTAFPVVLSDPPAPNETTLSPDQVKQAMDNLISDRNHLCSVAVADKTGSTPQDCGATGSTQNAATPAKP
ncbi:MAG: hypothetical protein ACRECV_09005 [Xanthobacteraceae bacterium]